MIKQPACERKCLLPLNSIAVGYRHAEERDVVPGTAQCPPPDMLPACDAGIHEREYRRSSSLACLLNAPSTADIFWEGWRDAGTVLPLVGNGAVLAIHPRKETYRDCFAITEIEWWNGLAICRCAASQMFCLWQRLPSRLTAWRVKT